MKTRRNAVADLKARFTLRSHEGQELSPVLPSMEKMGASRPLSSRSASTVPPSIPSRSSESVAESVARSTQEVEH